MDIENLLRSLNARDVRYVIIGATAFPVHGYARTTLDVDFFVSRRRKTRATPGPRCGTSATSDRSGGERLADQQDSHPPMLARDGHPSICRRVTFDQVWASRVEVMGKRVPRRGRDEMRALEPEDRVE